jgi:hypothetical protein
LDDLAAAAFTGVTDVAQPGKTVYSDWQHPV